MTEARAHGDLWGVPGPAAPPGLPVPRRERFQPLRAGILNLWQYDEQELWFEDGRLLLRGENGSGKSKALELLLPFLLDADLSPHRLDPFASTARKMEWNLLEGDLHASRLGYVWLELGRHDDEAAGGERYLTLGCGLRAARGRAGVDAWYFLSTQRVGRDLALAADRVPLVKEALRQALGEEGAVYDSGREYRERVDAALFGLGADRFAALRELLLQLRRPHLTEKLDPQGLSELLTNSLPPLDADLIGQISEGYERLEHDQAELTRIEAAAHAVDGFLAVYAEYAKGVARARAAEVRQADSLYHKTAAEVREAEEAAARVAAELATLAGRRLETDRAVDAARGAVKGYEQSEAMRQAAALAAKQELADSLEKQAERDQQDLEREERAHGERRREQELAAAEAGEAARHGEQAGERTADAAHGVGLEAVHAAAAGALAAQPQAAEATVGAAVAKRAREVDELAGLIREREAAHASWQRDEQLRQTADAQARAAAERHQQARAEAEAERERLAAALVEWSAGLAELRLTDQELAGLRAAALEEEGPGEALTSRVAAPAAPRRDALVEARTALEARQEQAAAERAEVVALRDRVASARELGPEPPRTRASDREGRPGAPLYLLAEFAPGLDPAAQAGLEAALEGSGLLDAWVSPEGRLLAPGTLDTLLTPAPLAAGETLADRLRPVPGHGVGREVIDAVLRSVAVAEGTAGGAEGLPHRVGLDGSWRLGPLQGAWAKPVAEHVGAGAREAARQRRLAELESRIAELDARLDGLAAELAEVARRLARLAEELRAMPPAAPLAHALARAGAAAADELRRRAELAEAEAAVARTRRAWDEAMRHLERRAQELALAAWVDDLEGHRLRLEHYRLAFGELRRAHDGAAAARRRAEQAAARLEEVAARVEQARERAAASRRKAGEARAEYEALERAVGADVADVLARLGAARGELERLEAELAALAREERRAGEARARIEERVGLLTAGQSERDAQRGKAVFRLQRLGQTGLLALFVPALPEEPPATWTLTRSLELARALEVATSDAELSDAAASRRANRMHARYQELVTELGAELQPSLAQEEELQVVRVMHNHQELGALELAAVLHAEVERRRSLLLDRERELLRRFLLGEVGDHLRKLLRQAEELVGETNDMLAAAATASGMRLRLAWRPGDEEAAAVRQAVELLRQAPELLADRDRLALEGFFEQRIDAARQDAQAVPWREHLMQALDYRRWHSFRIQRREAGDTGWRDLTRQSHAASSGGEKAVALHLPLFAAAAAHYRSARPSAPRLVLLDEAFAGIDEGMRGRCMALLVEFDLDFMMTSHDEWGCYEELPGVATYQLYRDPEVRGVAAIRFVWNGRQLAERPAT